MILIGNTVLSNFALAGELILLEDYCIGKGGTTDFSYCIIIYNSISSGSDKNENYFNNCGRP